MSGAALVGLGQADAQTGQLSGDAIRDILRRRVDVEKRATGIVVGTLDRGRRHVIAYGTQGAGATPPVGRTTLFEIGSVTKVFTALLLADMVRQPTAA